MFTPLLFTSELAHKPIKLVKHSIIADGRRVAQLPDFKPARQGAQKFTKANLAEHSAPDSGWIAVHGKVYDITNFLKHHPGYDMAGKVSTALAIKRCLGTECTEEFVSIHEGGSAAWGMLKDYYIGDLVADPAGRRD